MKVITDDTDHQPQRPWWTCGTCGHPWPCAPARQALRADFRDFPATLGVYLGGQYSAAVSDLWADLPPDLYTRIMLWPR